MANFLTRFIDEYEIDSAKTFRLALYLSILLHIFLLISYVNFTDWIPLALFNKPEPVPQTQPITFEIVESTEAEPDTPDPNTKRMSDRDTRARDQAPADIAEIDEAFNPGVVPSGEPPRPVVQPEPNQPQPQQEPQPEADATNDTQVPRTRIQQDFGDILTGKKQPENDSRNAESQPQSITEYQQEMFDNIVSKANARGDFSFSTYDFNWYDYAIRLKRKVRQNWYVPDAFRKFGLISGRTLVGFTIWPDGSVTDFRVIKHEGDKSLENSSANAIKLAAPFDPLPSDFPDEKLDITFGFYYLLPGEQARPFQHDPE